MSKKKTTKKKTDPKPKKPGKKTRTKGVQERKTVKLKKELDDLARALGVPTSKAKIITGKTATTIQIGSIIKVKRKKRAEAMTIVRKRARARL